VVVADAAVSVGEVFNDCKPVPGGVCAAWYSMVLTANQVQLQVVNVADPAQASLGERIRIDGRLVGTRQIGNLLYVVSSYHPRLAFDALPANATEAEREAALARLQATDLLPRVQVDRGVAQPLVGETDCFVQAANASNDLAVTTITAIDLATPALARTSRCVVGGTERCTCRRRASTWRPRDSACRRCRR